jgi:hypothetical protein
MVENFARTARDRIGIDGVGYHLRALTQRVRLADAEVRIMGSKATCLEPSPPRQAS